MAKYKLSTKLSGKEWLDNTTYVCHFEGVTQTDENGEEINVCVVAEYHKDENRIVIEMQVYSLDGSFLDSYNEIEAKMTQMEIAEYHTILSSNLFDNLDSWEGIVVADDYEAYDKLMDLIKDYYAKDDDNKAYEVEDYANLLFKEMFSKLDKKFLG